MRELISEYGRIILYCLVAAFCFGYIGYIMLVGDDTGIKGTADNYFKNASEVSQRSAGTNTDWKKYKAPEFSTVKTNISLMKREKSYTFTMEDGTTQTINCSEFVGLAKKWGTLNLTKYSLTNANLSTQPFYFYSTNMECVSSNSGSLQEITDKVKVKGILKNVYLITFTKNSDGTIKKTSDNTPIVKSIVEKDTYNMNGTIKSLQSEFDVIAFKNSGSNSFYYSVADDYDFKASVRVTITVEDRYTDAPSNIQPLWDKF